MVCNTLLLIDDDTDLREIIAEALEAEGYTVFKAKNGLEGLAILNEKYESHGIGGIILDLTMPVMDGKQFVAALLSQYEDRFSRIPIIVATAKGSPLKDLIPHASGRIQKPMELDELYRIVENLCGKPSE